MIKDIIITHSFISGSSLLNLLKDRYDIESADECVLLDIGQNDTYLVRSMSRRYIARVYSAGIRSISEIQYELDLLLYLDSKGAQVSLPVYDKNGELFFLIPTPEGERIVVLFTYVRGSSLSVGRNTNRQYGSAVAELHNRMTGFKSDYYRRSLDLKLLVEKPLKIIRPFLRHRKADIDYLIWISEELWSRLLELPLKALEWDVCHGDLHGGNGRIDTKGEVAFYDFDDCGMGWRAYELGVFAWSSHEHNQLDEVWPGFIEGYLSKRKLDRIDIKAISYFAVARCFWEMGLQASRADDWGHALVDDDYFNDQLESIEKWEKYLMGKCLL